MSVTTKTPGAPSAPNDLTEEVSSTGAAPNSLTEKAGTGSAAPVQLTERASTGSDAPNDLTEQALSGAAVPVNLSEEAASGASAPVNLAEAAASTSSAPNNLTEKASTSAAVPANLSEKAAVSSSAPANLAEKTLGQAAAPVNLTEKTPVAFPRTLTPILKLDFANELYADPVAKAISDIVTYTRNSNASFWNRRLNQYGKWETFLDTDYVGDVENLLTYSEQFDHADWTKENCTVVKSTVKSPVNNSFAYILTDAATTTQHDLRYDYTVTTGTNYNLSVYAKAGTLNHISLTFNSPEFDTPYRYSFDLVSGLIIGSPYAAYVPFIEYAGDGWWRVGIFSESIATGSVQMDIELYKEGEANPVIYLGDGTGTAYVWGAQLTASAKPLPYVKSISAATTETFVESPRLEYDPITAEALGYLAEGASTNLLTDSEDFATWSSNGSPTIGSNQATAPDGMKSMDLITATSTGSAVWLALTVAVSTDYTISIYAKNLDSTRSSFHFFDITGVDNQGFILIDWTGGVPSLNLSSGIVENVNFDHVGNGLYRISFTSTSDAANTSARVYFYPDSVDGDKAVYIWGAQCEALPFASSYIRTEGSTVARASDAMAYTTDLDNNGKDLTFQAEGSILGLHPTASQALAADRTLTNIIIYANVSFAQDAPSYYYGTSRRGFTGETSPVDVTTDYLVSVDQSLGTAIGYVDGTQVASNDIETLTASTFDLFVGCTGSGGSAALFGHVKNTSWYREAMTAQEVSLL